jgi:Transposase DDE domain
MLGAVMHLPLRQTECFAHSLMEVMKLSPAVPDYRTLARRRQTIDVHDSRWLRKRPVDIAIENTGLQFFGAGEWARAKHGKTRHSSRKLHLSVNSSDNTIIAHELTNDDTLDAAMIGGRLANSGGNIRAARPRRSPPRIFILPGKASVPDRHEPHSGTERERHTADIAAQGRMAWQRRHGYGKRSRVETAISCIKKNTGGRLTSTSFGAQQNEIAIHVTIANRNMILARPVPHTVVSMHQSPIQIHLKPTQ